jgi:thymidylate synthase (FAD)
MPSWQWHQLMSLRGAFQQGSIARAATPPSPVPVTLDTFPDPRSAPHAAKNREHVVPDIVPLKVQAIAWTHFEPPADVPWDTDTGGGEALAEFAGRACYQSWKKPNPATATNAGYLRHILEVGHLSVLEHGSVTFYLSGISRSLTHELIRHRHFSYSQLSQRYVPERDAAMVEPDVIAEDPELHAKFVAASEAAVQAYTELLEGLEKKFADVDHATLRRKQARQAARAVLPNATETRIVVTGNYRAWRHFVAMRASEHADVEIRELAIACLRELKRIAPNAFADFEVVSLPDGTEVAASPLANEG